MKTFYAFTAVSAVAPYAAAALLARYFRPTRQQLQLVKSFTLLLLGMFLSALATLNFSLAFAVGLLASPLSFVHLPVPPPEDYWDEAEEEEEEEEEAAEGQKTQTAKEQDNAIATTSSTTATATAATKADNTTGRGGRRRRQQRRQHGRNHQYRFPRSVVVYSVALHLLSPAVVLAACCRYYGGDVGAVLVRAAFGWRVWRMWTTQVVLCCVWWPAWCIGQMLLASSLF